MRQESGRRSYSPARWSTVGLVALAVFFTALDQTVVATVLPDVMVDLRIPVSKLDQASWIITGYLLGYTVVIPLAARLADTHGHAVLFRLSLVLFGAASVAVALSPDLPWLVGSRVVQAAGGGATIPIGLAIATHSMPSHRRAIAVGVIGAAAEMGVVLGPLYGGLITEAWGWRWLFWLDVPQALLILVALYRLPKILSSGHKVDYAGGLLLAAALTLTVVALSRRDLFDGSSPVPYALGGAAAAMFAALVWLERRKEQPLLPPVFFRSRAVLATLAAKLLMGAGLIISMVTVPLMANTVLERSSLEGGLMLMRLTGAVPVGALLGGYLAYRLGHRAVSALGLLVAAAGLFLMSGWKPDDGDAMLTLHLLQAGLGFGLVIAPLFVAAMDAGPGRLPGDLGLYGDGCPNDRHGAWSGGTERVGHGPVPAPRRRSAFGALARLRRPAGRGFHHAVPGLLPGVGLAVRGGAGAGRGYGWWEATGRGGVRRGRLAIVELLARLL